MRKISTIIAILFFIFSFLLPNQVKASPYSVPRLNLQNPNVEAISPMKEGQKAPFDGILYSTAAAAKMQVELENHEEQCQIKIKHEVARAEAKLKLDIDNLRAAQIATEKKYKNMMEIKNEQIEFLTQELQKQEKRNGNKWAPLYFAGGVVGGILITIAAGYSLGQIRN